MATTRSRSSRVRRAAIAASMLLGVLAGCNNGSDSVVIGPFVPDWPAESTDLTRGQELPGLHVEILAITGGSDTGGGFLPGDTVSVTFKVTKDDASPWRLDEFALGRTLISGPSFNYQRVIPEQRNVATAAVYNGDETYTYTYPVPLPAVYAAPLNDTASFGPNEGELAGQPLLAGTYTLGLYFRWSYTVDGESFRAAHNATADFLLGGASTIARREVVAQANCNACHTELQAHGGSRRDVRLCVLCHTSGAEDDNDGGATPGVSVDFRVMIHKIHNAANLPSVLGVQTNPDGSRNYAATPQPYIVSGDDFSSVKFPVWPNGLVAMPRDQGYTALGTTQKTQEDTIRMGVASCAACHGDPDGAGPLTAPAQGQIAFTQPTRRACGACHDDVDWARPYTSNAATMPPQNDDSACILCHESTGGALDPAIAHIHPVLDSNFNIGTNVAVTSVVESGTHNSDGTIDPGEKIAVTFRMTNDAGTDLSLVDFPTVSVIVSGPTSNGNILLNTTLRTAALTGSPPYTSKVPDTVVLEFIRDAAAAGGETFTTAMTPHWDVTGALTTVQVRTATSGGATTLAAASVAPSNYLDVVSSAGFARNEFVVVADGVSGEEEYLQVALVSGNRLYFSPTALRRPHAIGVTVNEVTLTTKTRTTDYTLAAATGTITEVTEFGAGNAVLVSYTTDFVMPATYPLALNDTPTMDETSGKWVGKSIVDGTYAVTMYASRTLTLAAFGETNSYRSTSLGARAEFLVGSAAVLEPYALISDAENCSACHKDVMFHGAGRRGFVACIACHGTAGSEDRSIITAANAPPTPGVTINFRTMLHKIHMGEHLANASSYTVVGFGSAAYPNNFTPHTYGEVVFPALPSGVKGCAKCHGATNDAWTLPGERNHPTQQGSPVRGWAFTCGACHDSDPATAHIEVQTSLGGVESCATCHGEGREWNVRLVHKVY